MAAGTAPATTSRSSRARCGIGSGCARALEELDVFWLEDFLHPENIAGYRAVAEQCTTLRVAAGEQYAGYQDFERLATRAESMCLQPDLSRCGGLTVGKQIADLATRRQIDCAPHAWLTDLLKAASLHLNAYLMQLALPGVQRLVRLAAQQCSATRASR